MTIASTFERLRAPLIAATVTAGVMTGALLLQHSRNGWPFSVPGQTEAGVVTTDGLEASTAPVSTGAYDRVPIDVDAQTLEQLGVRLEAVRRESLKRTIRAVATVVPDESAISHAHTRVAGWVDELDVNTTGEVVQAGQPLARIFSQELLSSQTEYLAARRQAASGLASVVVAGGRTRLGVLGMTEEDIATIERTGEPMRLVTIVASRSGVVVHRGVSVGTAVDPSTELLTIADLSRVWVFAEVSEADIPAVRVGSVAMLDFPAAGAAPFRARVDFLYPTITERTRTLRARLSVANPDGALRPGLYGTAAFEIATSRTLTVPRDAVVDTGLGQHVFVATGGRLEPRPVTLGARLAERVEIRSGLTEGEQVVASGVFLLDSESRLRATGGADSHSHSAPAQGDQPPAATPETPHAGHGK
ncbi:MAG: hypothetical protein A3G76_01085 [Acidobacteria bacterium RIFCSPLOWO2_12_FULL_65_11]|nr:MAG: hypothetical protein A3H95_16345 [Acidobacteria bacterium RIFCSPLOWO2_02_FULL_64_15]OFW33404.1 MAG: hypothetical protein A3G76_01085 [Acidobacteria bacterium RIFCSPLOWO2_12_FULL_65_11]